MLIVKATLKTINSVSLPSGSYTNYVKHVLFVLKLLVMGFFVGSFFVFFGWVGAEMIA